MNSKKQLDEAERAAVNEELEREAPTFPKQKDWKKIIENIRESREKKKEN